MCLLSFVSLFSIEGSVIIKLRMKSIALGNKVQTKKFSKIIITYFGFITKRQKFIHSPIIITAKYTFQKNQ